jgi:hypothetical protein
MKLFESISASSVSSNRIVPSSQPAVGMRRCESSDLNIDSRARRACCA